MNYEWVVPGSPALSYGPAVSVGVNFKGATNTPPLPSDVGLVFLESVPISFQQLRSYIALRTCSVR